MYDFVSQCLPHTLVKMRSELRAWEGAGWSCTIATTCCQIYRLREKSRELGRVAFADGPVSMCGRACNGCGRAGRGYAGARSLQLAISSRSSARRVEDSVGLRSPMDLLTCWSKRAVHAGERAAGGAYADAQALQYAVSSLGRARINPRGVLDSVGLR